MTRSTKSTAPAPEVNEGVEDTEVHATDEQIEAAIAAGEAQLAAELEAAESVEPPADEDPEGDDNPSEPEVELSPVQIRNKLRAELVTAIHAAGVMGLSVLSNREEQQALHAKAVELREAGKAARDAHKVLRDRVAAIRAQLKD